MSVATAGPLGTLTDMGLARKLMRGSGKRRLYIMSKSEATTGAKLTGPRESASSKGSRPGADVSAPVNVIGPADRAASTPLGRMTIRGHAVGGGLHGALAGFRTPVVLKKVLPHLACNPEFIDMFLDEARIASLLDHPNVVRIYEVGRSDHEYFLAMELVQGKPLQALLRKAHETQASMLEPRLAAFIVAQAAAGLHHAHNLTDPLGNTLGLVHRDVSPQNILLSFEGSVKVIDFGVARALGRITETQTGGMKGKFGYMSPEQARGEDLDLRADIFALGVVLWESVTGRRLFQRDNDLATMRALIYDPIPKPSSVVPVAEGLEAIILRALTRDPAVRFQTARDLANALERFVVLSGGASAGDLGAVMKTLFAQDYASWQQTIRSAVNLPAQGTEPAPPVPAQPSTLLSRAGAGASAALAGLRRRPPLAIGIGAALLALVVLLFLAVRKPEPGPGAAPEQAALARPTFEPAATRPAPDLAIPFGPPPPYVAPGALPPPGPAVGTTPSGSRVTRRKPAATARTGPARPKPPGGSDRRPNPF
jgi:serine/threonine protein kinase